MEEVTPSKEFNHAKASTSDAIRFIGEAEHIRAHAIRSAVVAFIEEDDGKAFKYSIVAHRAQQIRRDFMREHFGDRISTKDWCLCKSAATLRQIAYEIYEANTEELSEIDNLVDDIWGAALGEDLSDCEACKSDMESDIVEE